MPSGDTHNRESANAQRARRLAAEASVRSCEMDMRRGERETTLAVKGEFDASCVLRYERLLRDAVEEEPAPCLLVDLSEVTFIDSTGLALLLRTEAASRQDGFELEIRRSPAAAVRSAVEASGLERVLPFRDDADE